MATNQTKLGFLAVNYKKTKIVFLSDSKLGEIPFSRIFEAGVSKRPAKRILVPAQSRVLGLPMEKGDLFVFLPKSC
jgi:hypothetical protein